MSDLAPPPFEPATLVGTTLDGRYALAAHLATGGMGAVFRARHVHLRKDVAVKVLRPDLSSAPEIVERFRREAEIASALEHENIVRVTDFGRSAEGYLFLVMELLSGESLFDRLRREGFLTPEDAVKVLWQICSGLEAAHALGVVHRDLKPENVFLARTPGGREVAKLLDFGICKIADPEDGATTQAGLVVGTPEYLAPEQATGDPVDHRADLYAVGLIAWRMLAGRHPYRATDAQGFVAAHVSSPVPALTDARPDLAGWPALVHAVAHACEKQPARRPQSAAALREELAAALGPAFLAPPYLTPSSPSPAPALSWGPARPSGGAAPAVSLPVSVSAPGQTAHVILEPAPRPSLAPALPPSPVPAEAPAPTHRRRWPAIAAGVLGALVLAGGLAGVSVWHRDRAAVAEVREALDAGRVADAADAAQAALRRRPREPELLLLRARALHRIPGREAESIQAYRAARDAAPLDAAGLEDLAADLGRDKVAAEAARLLRTAGAPAIPPVSRAAEALGGWARLRAMGVLRDLGAEDRVDRARLYGALLGDPDCELRRAAARRLGETGDRAALPRLRQAARSTVPRHGLFGVEIRDPACGAAEAEAAVRRIEAAQKAAGR